LIIIYYPNKKYIKTKKTRNIEKLWISKYY
jgi:hypothetical protein